MFTSVKVQISLSYCGYSVVVKVKLTSAQVEVFPGRCRAPYATAPLAVACFYPNVPRIQVKVQVATNRPRFT